MHKNYLYTYFYIPEFNTKENLYIATNSFTFSRSSGVLPDDREDMKQLVAMCSFSSVLNSSVCIALLCVLSTLLIDATTSEHSIFIFIYSTTSCHLLNVS